MLQGRKRQDYENKFKDALVAFLNKAVSMPGVSVDFDRFIRVALVDSLKDGASFQFDFDDSLCDEAERHAREAASAVLYDREAIDSSAGQFVDKLQQFTSCAVDMLQEYLNPDRKPNQHMAYGVSDTPHEQGQDLSAMIKADSVDELIKGFNQMLADFKLPKTLRIPPLSPDKGDDRGRGGR